VEVFNVSNWEVVNLDASGSREKKWLENPNDKQKYLFKEPKSFGEIYAEYVAYLIGVNNFNLTIPEVSIAKYNDIYGVIVKDFVNNKSHTFSEISDYLQWRNPNFDPMNIWDYKLECCIEVMENFNLLEVFFEMCIFDTIIANQDRHCENWGTLESIDYPICLAPLYDNGSSLGCLLTETEVKEYLNEETKFKKFTNRAKTPFTFSGSKKIRIKLLVQTLVGKNRIVFEKVFKKFSSISYDEIYETIESVNNEFLSEDRKMFVAKLVNYRMGCIAEWLEEGNEDNE